MTSTLPAPLKDVHPGERPGVFIARGDDPQMVWAPPKDRRDLRHRGAICVTVSMSVVEGKLSNPTIYADWGDGVSDQTRKNLSQVSEGVYRGVAYTNAGSLRKLRFDPSQGPCVFELTSFTVEPAADGAHPAPPISNPRRWGRAILRRLPPPVQMLMRRAVGRLRNSAPLAAIVHAFKQTRTRAWRESYTHAFEVARNLRSPDFAAPPTSPPHRQEDGPRVLAFYLPQFHPIPENDAWWGSGFTEWSNVSKATPQFTGHLQPRHPADLGFYDLRVPEVRHKQVALARNIGIDGFCFHYYWFGGKRLLEQPLDDFVNDPDLDFPFALCWANENWTRRWDGQDADILIGQRHSPEDDVAVLDDLATYMRSPRYIRVAGRPLILVYRPDALPDAGATIGRWRERARAKGLGELFVACTTAFGFTSFEASGFDALVEFPPHALVVGEITNDVELLNPNFAGRVYDYEAVVNARVADLMAERDPRHLPGVMPNWDNEARKPGAGNVFHNATPALFHIWIKAALKAANASGDPAGRLVFINAWNEWAEGAYLEPDRWFGHAFGQALRSAIENTAPRLSPPSARNDVVLKKAGRAKAVVLLHLYYPDMIDEFAERLKGTAPFADLSISFPDTWTPQAFARLDQAFPTARLASYPNIGRDIAPFIAELRWANDQGYDVFCKIHSKRSPHMPSGDEWRNSLLSPLLDNTQAIIAKFQADRRLGLLAGADAPRRLGEQGVMQNNAVAMAHLGRRLNFTYDDDTIFPAGTMFWGRVVAFRALIDAGDLPFEPELGRIDGTLAHALERAMAAIVTASGRRADWTLV